MSGLFCARFASLLVLGLLGFTCISGLSVVQTSSATTKSQVTLSSSGSTLVGGELWLNNSYPFESEARSSTILALPTLSAWLSSHGISIDQLRPYVTLWSSQGNPYDYAQGTVGFAGNGTVYKDYDYILPNGTVIGVAVSEGSPEVVAAVSTFPSQDNTLSSTGYTVDSENGAGHQAEGPNSLTNYFDGAEYNTTVFSDLTNLLAVAPIAGIGSTGWGRATTTGRVALAAVHSSSKLNWPTGEVMKGNRLTVGRAHTRQTVFSSNTPWTAPH